MIKLEDLIKTESLLNNDVMESEDIKLLEKIMESKPIVSIAKNKQNKLSRVVKNNRYLFWQGKNEIDVARNSVGFNPIKISIRKCLKCQASFESEGIQNRICELCRKSND